MPPIRPGIRRQPHRSRTYPRGRLGFGTCAPGGEEPRGRASMSAQPEPSLREGTDIVAGGQARHLASVDQLLLAPVVDGLVADLQIVRDLGDGAACLKQVQGPCGGTPADSALACRLSWGQWHASQLVFRDFGGDGWLS